MLNFMSMVYISIIYHEDTLNIVHGWTDGQREIQMERCTASHHNTSI